MNRNDILVAALACAEGKPLTPAQLQKAMFLIAKNAPQLVNDGPNYNFVPYDYGPFDKAVYDEAAVLRASGLANITPAAAGRWSEYAATEAGVTKGAELLSHMAPSMRAYSKGRPGSVF